MRGSGIHTQDDNFSVHDLNIPDIEEETLKKLPYWKRWLYKTLREIEKEQ